MRRTFIVLPLVVLLAAAGYAVYAHLAVAAFEDALARWVEARRVEGYDVRLGALDVRAVPVVLEGRLDSAVLARAGRERSWELRLGPTTITAPPWEIRRIALDTAAPAEFAVVDMAGGGTVRLSADRARADGAFAGDGRLVDGTLELAGATIALPGRDPAALASARLGFEGAGDGGGPTIALRALGLDLGPGAPAELGATVDSVTATLAARPDWPVAAAAPALESWRRQGGELDIRFAELVWGPLAVKASGTLRLDAALQPAGTVSASARGYRAVVDAVESQGRLRAEDAAQLRLVLDLFAQRPRDGGPPELAVDLTIAGREVRAGMVPLGRLPRVEWPE